MRLPSLRLWPLCGFALAIPPTPFPLGKGWAAHLSGTRTARTGLRLRSPLRGLALTPQPPLPPLGGRGGAQHQALRRRTAINRCNQSNVLSVPQPRWGEGDERNGAMTAAHATMFWGWRSSPAFAVPSALHSHHPSLAGQGVGHPAGGSRGACFTAEDAEGAGVFDRRGRQGRRDF